MIRRPLNATLLTFLLSGMLAGAAMAAQVSVLNPHAQVGDPLLVKVDGLSPGREISIHVRLTDDAGATWLSQARYRANAQGVVETATTPSTGGSYSGVSSDGLTCALLPVEPDQVDDYLARLPQIQGASLAPRFGNGAQFTYQVTVRSGGQEIGRAIAVRDHLLPGTELRDVSEGRLRGVYYRPANATGAPVLVIGGSEGGVPRSQAALLASRGHPALAIGFFGYGDLPAAFVNIPIETFAEGVAWLARETGKDVVVMGTSRGTEAAQLTAILFPQRIAGLILYVPSHLVHGGFGPDVQEWQSSWTYGGRMIPHSTTSTDPAVMAMIPEEVADAGRSPPGIAGSPFFLPHWTDPRAEELFGIRVERLNVPLIVIGGEADAIWPSAVGATRIRDRLAAHGKAGLVELHNYPDAGHAIARPGLGSRLSGSAYHPVARIWIALGGTPAGNCAASVDAWGHVMRFLTQRGAGNSTAQAATR